MPEISKISEHIHSNGHYSFFMEIINGTVAYDKFGEEIERMFSKFLGKSCQPK